MTTSRHIASLAAHMLGDPISPPDVRSVAGSDLAQAARPKDIAGGFAQLGGLFPATFWVRKPTLAQVLAEWSAR